MSHENPPDPECPNNPANQDKEVRRSFLNFLQGCFQMDPTKRWTPDQARAHPFINGEVLPESWTPPPAKRPTPPNQPPKPKEPSSRSQPDVNVYYSKFCAAMMQHQIIDVASGNVLAELNDPLNPPTTDKTIPVPVATRGNRANSVSVRTGGIPMPTVASPGSSGLMSPMSPSSSVTSGASSLSPFMIRARVGMPVSSGTAFGSTSSQEQNDYVSASANVASAAELHARMMSGVTSSRGDRKKSHKKRQPTGLAVDTTMQDQPFNMDGDSGDETPSEGSGDMLSPNSPRDKRLPVFSNLERDRSEEVAASWSYMPQQPNAGMPRVRPQQPELQDITGPSTKITPLSFGIPSSSSSSSVSGSCGGDSTPRGGDSTPRHRSKHKHRQKEGSNSSEVIPQGKSPLSALTFGNPTTKSPMSPLTESMDNVSLNDAQSAKGPTIEIRVRQKPEAEADK